MNLFKPVRAFSRGRYAAHPFYECIHGEEEMVCAQKEWGIVELLLLLSLLAVRRMRHEYTRTMSKNADNEYWLEEVPTLHPCFIALFVVLYCCLLFEKMCSLYHRAIGMSSVVSEKKWAFSSSFVHHTRNSVHIQVLLYFPLDKYTYILYVC